MDLSVIAVGDVENVLSAMQKNLECPICLDVVKEPVSTKCDHIFCRFCMFKLLSKKKQGATQCPLCKTEVTKRSLQENSRFKQLIEGLLEVIHAFELDTGVRFLSSHHSPKAPQKAPAAELLCHESSVVQSKGFRNRKRTAEENGQENCTSQEAHVDAKLTATQGRRCLRNRNQRCGVGRGVPIELGTDSSEELLKQASSAGLGDKEELEEPEQSSETDFPKEALSKNSVQDTAERARPDHVGVIECQSSPLNVLAADLLTGLHDGTGGASPPEGGDASPSEHAEEMDAEPTQCSSKSQEFDLEDSSENRLDKISVEQSMEDVEMCEPASDPSPGNEPALEKLLQAKTLPCPTTPQVSRKRLKRSIQKVNEWFSKSKEILASNSSQEDPAEGSDASGGAAAVSDEDSCVSEQTSPVVGFVGAAVAEGSKRQTTYSIKDKIFGKTYERERKSNPPVVFREILPTAKKEGVAAEEERVDESRRDRLKRKRKSVPVLQPEDFIKRKDVGEAGGCPQSVNCSLGDAEKKKGAESPAAEEHPLHGKGKGSTPVELEGGGSKWSSAPEQLAGECPAGELALNSSAQKSTKTTSSAAQRCRRSSRSRCALQLVVDRTSGSPNLSEAQIDSCPSSQEPGRAGPGQGGVRRSRRLQLLSEEMGKERGKGRGSEGARNCDGDHQGSFSGVERNVLVHSSECREQQGGLSCRGAELDASETKLSPKSSPGAARTGESLFDPTSSCQQSSCNSSSPRAGSRGSDSPVFQSPSKAVVPPAPNLPEEKRPESCAPPAQDKGRCAQNVPENFRTEKSPVVKRGLESSREAEDSELDTQELRSIFKSSKRLSFSLYPTATKACPRGGAVSEKPKIPCADEAEERQGEYLKAEILREERTVEGVSSAGEEEKLRGCESAGVGPVPHLVGSAGEGAAEAADQGSSRRGAAGSRLPEEGQGSGKTGSGEMGGERKLRESPGGGRTQRGQSTAGEGSASEQAGGAGAGGDKGAVQLFQPCSALCPAAQQQNPGEFSCTGTANKGGRRERRRVGGRGEPATQTVSTGMPEFSAGEDLEEPLKGSGDGTDLSDTPDGLLCSDNDPEDSSFCVASRKDRSAVFLKSGSALVTELSGCEPPPKGIPRPRRRARKLQSSDEESSEDEDLPCLQALIFGQAASTPLQLGKQGAPEAGPSTVPGSGQRAGTRGLSPSLDSECSVNLFSSQSNVSEDSADGVPELKKPSVRAHASGRVSNGDGSREAPQSCSGGLKRGKTNCRDERQGDPNVGANLGEASDSDTSRVEDSCEPFSQGEILSTQQKNAMHSNLRKLQQEMAVLEAVLQQQGSQEAEPLPACGVESALDGNFGNHTRGPPERCSANDFRAAGSDSPNSEVLELERESSPELLIPSLQSCLPKRPDPEGDLQHGSVLRNKAPEAKPVQETSPREAENAPEQEPGTRLTGTPALDLCGDQSRSPNSSPPAQPPRPPAAEAADGSRAQSGDKSHAQGRKSKKSVCVPTSVPRSAAGGEKAASPGVAGRREMSIVASGLSQSEHLMVQKFARKTQSTFSSQITDGTTHVVMKTDEELVCERTLKYFLGIAGGKWVLSYQWITQSFKEGRILDEESFEVRGDVINGRNHQGPKRARQSLTGKIFQDFEICCYGPFTDMTPGHLEWMVGLCGASVVKGLRQFTHRAGSTAVVVVQPDAWKESTSCEAVQQQDGVVVVTREWVLDSVARYERQQLGAYRLC